MAKSLRWRLQAWYGLVLLAVVGSFAVILYTGVRSAKFEQLDTRLRAAAVFLEAALRPLPAWMLEEGGAPPPPPLSGRPKGGPPPAPKGRGGPPTRKPPEQLIAELQPPELAHGDDEPLVFAIWRGDGTILKVVPGMEAFPMSAPPSDLSERVSVGAQDQFRYAAVRGPFASSIVVARSIRTELAELRRFAGQLLGAGAAVLLIGLLGGALSASRFIKPIAEMSATAERISETNLGERVNTQTTDRELSELAQVLNGTFDRLQGAFERQTQFTADASHELRTPLAVIRSQTEWAMSRQRSDTELRESLEVCHHAAGQMTDLVDGLLTLARTDAGSPDMKRQPCLLDRIAADTAEMMHALAKKRGISMAVNVKPVTAIGDATALGRVVSNLIKNAIEYNRTGGVVHVRVYTDEMVAVLEVTDSGIGVPPAELPFLFDRFHRVDKARSRAAGGSGLGLAICKSTVEAHGGTIECRSELGRGSTFSVRLPRTVDPT